MLPVLSCTQYISFCTAAVSEYRVHKQDNAPHHTQPTAGKLRDTPTAVPPATQQSAVLYSAVLLVQYTECCCVGHVLQYCTVSVLNSSSAAWRVGRREEDRKDE